jgi:hypothetical protein
VSQTSGTALRQRFSAKVFQAPPNWPQPTPGWRPPPGWQPDPGWGPPPPGWRLWTRRNPHAFRIALACGLVPLLFWLSWNIVSADQVKPSVLIFDAAATVVPVIACGTIAHFSPWRFRWWAYLGLMIIMVIVTIVALLALVAVGVFMLFWLEA